MQQLRIATVEGETQIDISRATVRSRKSLVVEVFEFWRALLSNSRSRLDQDRERKIGAMLDIGYTVDDLKLACIGCALSPHHQGLNDRNTRYQDIELICRYARFVDKFIDIAERHAERILAEREKQRDADAPRTPPSAETREKIEALMKSLKVRRS